uniref:Putative ovule protein n=1 Tax=Solanum chacoense TaxID=4108 RepID=A0A0V0GWY5_SOLCH
MPAIIWCWGVENNQGSLAYTSRKHGYKSGGWYRNRVLERCIEQPDLMIYSEDATILRQLSLSIGLLRGGIYPLEGI